MAVLDEDNVKHGGSQPAAAKPTVAPVPPTTTASTTTSAGSSTTLTPGPMELGTFSGATPSSESDFSQCARCRGYGHWSLACPTPRIWRRGDPIAGRTSARGRSTGRGDSGKRGKSRLPSSRGARSQACNTEADSGIREMRWAEMRAVEGHVTALTYVSLQWKTLLTKSTSPSLIWPTPSRTKRLRKQCICTSSGHTVMAEPRSLPDRYL